MMSFWTPIAQAVHADVVQLILVTSPLFVASWLSRRGVKNEAKAIKTLNTLEHEENARKLDIVVTEVQGFKEWREEHNRVHDQINERIRTY